MVERRKDESGILTAIKAVDCAHQLFKSADDRFAGGGILGPRVAVLGPLKLRMEAARWPAF
jgi:hypothetical protein